MMEVTQVGVHLLNNPESRVRAVVWIILDGALRINSLRVVEGRHGLFVSYPGELKKGTDQWFNIVHPVNPQVQDNITHKILLAYNTLRGTAEGSEIKITGLPHA